jgi:hypothetical protein
MAAKRHHTVPQLLLRRFASEDGLVRMVERDDFSKWFDTGTVGALAQKHFYTIDTAEGPDTGVEEDLLAKHVEAPAARALRRVVDEGMFPPMPGLRETLSIFLAFQFVRGPGMRAALLEEYEAFAKMGSSRATAEMVRRYVKQDDGSELPHDEVQELLRDLHDTESWRIVPSSEANHHLGAVLPMVFDLVPYFEQRRWHLMSFPAPVLITGDEPIGLVGLSTSPGDGALGIKTASEIVIPVDPVHAFLLLPGDHPLPEGRLTGRPEMARIINNHVGYACHRYLVHRPGTDPLRGLTLAKKGRRIRIQGDKLSMSPRPPRRRPRKSR